MKRMVSGIKPSGSLTLGNYIGAIKHFIAYQDSYELFVFIANLHAITVPQDKQELKKNTKDLAALYLACGLDPKKATLFVQSEILEHATLAFIFDCTTYMGELSRMTQYKDQSTKNQDTSISVGLFTYPNLMAADILLYDPDFVPVGDDQKQHVELTRNIAERFNQRHGMTFQVPQPLIPESGARIMSLTDPTKKMSKSDDAADRGCIYLLDDPKVARKKIMSAVTDSDTAIRYDPVSKPGISNLLTIMSSLTDTPIPSLEQQYAHANYGLFKSDLASIVENFLISLQDRFQQIITNKIVDQVFEEGAKKAKTIAARKLEKVYKKIGF